MNKMTWCDHINNTKGVLTYDFGRAGMIIPEYCYFHFCPICGTPRPKEKSLAEKFQDILSGKVIAVNQLGGDDSKRLIDNLVRVTEEHHWEAK